MSIFGRGTDFLNSLNRGSKGRPPLEAFYVYVLALLLGYFISDIAILSVRPAMLPLNPPPVRPPKQTQAAFTTEQQYEKIATRNVFNSDGKIPPKITSDGGSGGEPIDAAPVASQLPLKLEGTLVHSNPKKSVATITLKSKNEVQSFMVDQEIESLARVTAIERRKVIFRNLNNQRLEFIDIPQDNVVNLGKVQNPVVQQGDDLVKKSGEYDFTMNRADINKMTGDLGSILQQARMVPNIVPGSAGQVNGFKFVAIQPGSIYEKLGFKPMDVIKGVNGEPVNSPTKAMELYNALKTQSNIKLQVERNGREEQFNYNISE